VSRFLTPIRAVPIFRSPRSSDPTRWRAIPAIGAPRAHPPLPVHPTSSQVIPDWRSFQRFCGTGTPACAPYDSWTAGALACDRSIRFSDHSIFRSPDHPISAAPPPCTPSRIQKDLRDSTPGISEFNPGGYPQNQASSVLISGKTCRSDHPMTRSPDHPISDQWVCPKPTLRSIRDHPRPSAVSPSLPPCPHVPSVVKAFGFDFVCFPLRPLRALR